MKGHIYVLAMNNTNTRNVARMLHININTVIRILRQINLAV
ncbi:IS1-like element transposase [Candidatus Enterovibrio altilux]